MGDGLNHDGDNEDDKAPTTLGIVVLPDRGLLHLLLELLFGRRRRGRGCGWHPQEVHHGLLRLVVLGARIDVQRPVETILREEARVQITCQKSAWQLYALLTGVLQNSAGTTGHFTVKARVSFGPAAAAAEKSSK